MAKAAYHHNKSSLGVGVGLGVPEGRGRNQEGEGQRRNHGGARGAGVGGSQKKGEWADHTLVRKSLPSFAWGPFLPVGWGGGRRVERGGGGVNAKWPPASDRLKFS